MSIRSAIGTIAGLGADALMGNATLDRGGDVYEVRASRQRTYRPASAATTGRRYDARLHVLSGPVQPRQNDRVTIDGQEWIVWRIEDSPAGSHHVIDAFAPPARIVQFLSVSRASDGGGGSVLEQQDPATAPEVAAWVTVRRSQRQLSNQADEVSYSSELIVRGEDVPDDLSNAHLARLDGFTYSISDITPDADNREYLRVMLSRRV